MFKRPLSWIVLALAFTAPASSLHVVAAGQPQAANPFFQEWTTPFGVPPFQQIRPEHFMPAFRQAIADQRKEVEAIADDPQPPTFANTIEALDRSGQLMVKVGGVFGNLSSANTNEQLQAINREVTPLRSATTSGWTRSSSPGSRPSGRTGTRRS